MQQKPSTIEDYHERINLIIEYINNHLDENIDLGKLADMSHFSRFHFHRIAKAFLGEPVGSFITRMRIETAARLLRYTDIPVMDIAYKVGYDVPSSLSKTFKQFYGISPNDYRNNKTFTIMKPFQVKPELKLEEKVSVFGDKQVLYVRLTGDYIKNDYCGAWQKLWQFVFSEKIKITEAEFICIYHDDPKVTESGKLRTDVCLVINKQVSPKGEIGVKTIRGGRYVVYTYEGPYENLGSVYDTIYGKYIPEGGYAIDQKPGFEKYLNSPEDTAPEKLLTEIYVPVL